MTSSPATPNRPGPPLRKRCFDPVVDQGTGLLVLGSLPGDKSLLLQEYYGNRQNQFWALMSEVIGLELVSLDYFTRLKALLGHGVGLWDVVAEAHRNGSLDSHIKERHDNDLRGLLFHHPNIKAIAFNGGTAAQLGIRVLGAQVSDYQIVELPSSSPAYTLPYSEKARRWQVLRHILADAQVGGARQTFGLPTPVPSDAINADEVS